MAVFERDSLPLDTDYDVRQRIYLIALQIAAYLLCGQSVVVGAAAAAGGVFGSFGGRYNNPVNASPVMKPTPPKKTALDPSAAASVTTPASLGKSPIAVSASKIVQTMLDIEFGDAVSCLVRVVWAAAAGNLRLASSSGGLGSAHSDQQASR